VIAVTISDTFALLAGVPLVVVVPQLVNLAKQQGLPTRYAGVAAIACSIVLLALAGFALDPEITVADGARWMIGGVVYGLAAAGLHSQRRTLSRPSSPTPDETTSP
jgi:hypothetical protein